MMDHRNIVQVAISMTGVVFVVSDDRLLFKMRGDQWELQPPLPSEDVETLLDVFVLKPPSDRMRAKAAERRGGAA